MKKNLFFLFALVAMMCVSTQSWAAQVTFRFVHDGNAITSWNNTPSVAIYKAGVQLTTGYAYNSGTATLYVDDSYVGQTVAYISSLGHQGSFTVTDSEKNVDLECKKLTITTKDKDGNALSYQYVYVYDENGKSYSVSTDYEGNGSLYLFASSAYTFRWDDENQTGNIDLTNDYELNLVKGESVSPVINTDYNVMVVCRYGDYPVSFSSNYSSASFYIYKYGETSDYTKYSYLYGSNNSFVTELPAGSYWIKDPNSAFSQKIEVKGDMTAYLDYQKVKFISKTGNTPNAGQVITYKGNNNNSYSYDTRSVTTNANGEASVYLLPGNYIYTVNGASYNFTVGNVDQTINIKTSKVVITLNCDDQSALDNQSFEWSASTSGNPSSSGSYTNVRPENGKITIGAMPGNYVLTVNDISTVNVTVNEGENNVNVQLYSVKFTTNQSMANSLYLGKPNNYNKKQIGFYTKYYLTQGEYSYSFSSYSSSSDKAFTLDSNKEIAINYGTVTVTVNDTDGNAVSGMSVSATTANSSTYTDANGQAVLTVPYGTCVISIRDDNNYTGYGSKTVNVSGDTYEEFTIPGIVTFNVLRDGQPVVNSNIYLRDKYGSSVYANCVDGVAKARIASGETWRVESHKGSVVITEGCTVSLGTLSVSSEGKGVAFPRDEWDDVNTYNVVVGSTVRLTAIPAMDDMFQCWVVNGQEIYSPVIDLELVDVHTVATAVFDGAAPSARAVRGDVNTDGKVNIGDIVTVSNIMAGNE